MPRDPQMLLFVGIKKAVVALDHRTGVEVWRAELRASDYVSVLWDGEALFASSRGEVWRLDPRTGGVLWHNELKGLGWGIASLASSRAREATPGSGDLLGAAKKRRDTQAATAAG